MGPEEPEMQCCLSEGVMKRQWIGRPILEADYFGEWSEPQVRLEPALLGILLGDGDV